MTDINVCCIGVDGNDLATIDFEIDGSKDRSNFPVSNFPVLKKVLIGNVATRARQIFLELSIEKGWDILALEVAPDHVHLFVAVKPTDVPALVVKLFKGRSSRYLREEFPELKKLPSLWTSSYFVSTAGNISSEVVKKYIEDPHHSAN